MKKLLLIAMALLYSVAYSQVTVTGAATNATYATLYAAFTAINAQNQAGQTIAISITADVTEATNFPMLNAGAWTSLTITPSGARRISGNQPGYFIFLNGADNVTINGLNTGGNSLTIENTSTSTSAVTVILMSTAINNTITNCTILGSNPSPSWGVITIYSTNVTGNNNNTISYCNIGPSGSNTPAVGILSTGGPSVGNNSGNIIDHCNIYDNFVAAGADYGIYLSAYATGWSITNNSFYQTVSRAKASGNSYAVHVNAGDGYYISGNYFGGNTAQCAGTQLTYTGSMGSLNGIYFSTAAANVNKNIITGNIFKNISLTSGGDAASNSSNANFTCISFRYGKYSITNNQIGVTNANDNITLTRSGPNYCIFNFINTSRQSPNYPTVDTCSNNTIGGITIDATYYQCSLMYFDSYVPVRMVQNNIFGSSTQANSISLSLTTPSVNSLAFIGVSVNSINNNVSTTTTVSDNMFQNITGGTVPTPSSSNAGLIGVGNSYATISNNTIKNISSSGDLSAIAITSSLTNILIKGNTITNCSGYYDVYGIKTIANNPTVEQNFIASIKSNSALQSVYGIYTKNSTNGGTIQNNIISLGYADVLNSYKYGIYSYYGSSIYFNTVSIGGTGTSGTNHSAGFYFAVSGTVSIINNIFSNYRVNAGGSGSSYAIYINNAPTSATMNWNDYYAPNSGGVIGYWYNGGVKATLSSWKTATSQDANSLNTDPVFDNAGGTTAGSYKTSGSLSGTNSTGITTDYSGITRNATPTMGALDGANPLPVELTSFTAEVAEKSVELKWRTATEVNNYGFEVERRAENERHLEGDAHLAWTKIGFVEGNGTTNAPKSYSFTDKNASGKISYRLKQIDRDGKFEYSQTVEVTAVSAPKEFGLEQNYPNPFNPTTAIGYQLSANSFTTLKVYDAIGREVATLVNEVKDAGYYSAQFNGAKLSSGIYFAKLTSDRKTQMKKLLLLK